MDNHTHESVLESRKGSVLLRWLSAWCAAVAVLAGCATTNMGNSGEEIVAKRAQERWDLLVKSDFSSAYQYISPAGRQLVTPGAYGAGLKRDFWTGAKVGQVHCATAEACEVDVVIEYQHRGLRMKTGVREKWVREKSNWWFLLER